jgi:hypothetical protein
MLKPKLNTVAAPPMEISRNAKASVAVSNSREVGEPSVGLNGTELAP